MPLTTRTAIQEIALVVLGAAAVVAAIWFAAKGFMAAAFIGTATMCAFVLTAATLNRRGPNTWGPASIRARRLPSLTPFPLSSSRSMSAACSSNPKIARNLKHDLRFHDV